jgi:hypothetical protein
MTVPKIRALTATETPGLEHTGRSSCRRAALYGHRRGISEPGRPAAIAPMLNIRNRGS